MNQCIRHRKALRDMPLSMARAPGKSPISELIKRGMRYGGWIVVGLSLAVIAAGIARWWLG